MPHRHILPVTKHTLRTPQASTLAARSARCRVAGWHCALFISPRASTPTRDPPPPAPLHLTSNAQKTRQRARTPGFCVAVVN
jgi:hypothetical protein